MMLEKLKAHASKLLALLASAATLYGAPTLTANLIDVVRYQTEQKVAYNHQDEAYQAGDIDEQPEDLQSWVTSSPFKVLAGLPGMESVIGGIGASWSAVAISALLGFVSKRKESAPEARQEPSKTTPAVHKKIFVVCDSAIVRTWEENNAESKGNSQENG